ncbi:hypothetical protein [Ponticaulis profundi]|uniref:Uncharacterized protein n=1 Tax=Ponticaulis profundi TaxID=2665222 RepID=A0ABW1S8X1_9PROT
MRLFLIIVGILIVLAVGGIFWLAGEAEKNPPSSTQLEFEVDLDD